MEQKPHLLICDDEQVVHLAIKQALKGKYRFTSAHDGKEALAVVKAQPVDLVILDVNLTRPLEGLDTLPLLLEADPRLDVVMNSGVTDFDVVRKAMQLGASDYLSKDFEPSELELTLERALKVRDLRRRSDQQRYEVDTTQKRHVLVGDSPALREIRKIAEKVTRSGANVVIFGETGSGKEVVARLLRRRLPDGGLEPFVAVDSSTIQSTMAESLLFGHEKGAFTGAERSTRGIFEEANGGTVYFDEVANMPLDIQAKLLRVLQEKEVTRVGSAKTVQLDFRVVCATNQDLEEMVKQGRFKPDLFQRLNVIPIRIPPLRERKEDLPALVDHLVRAQGGTQTFSQDALAALASYDWPGNVRELGNVIAYVLTMAESPVLEMADLPHRLRDVRPPAAAGPAPAGQGLYEQMEAFEKRILSEAFQRSGGNVSKMAMDLGVDRSHLYTKLRQHGLHPQQRKES
jgi:DNA-binding NtrC family response regulator